MMHKLLDFKNSSIEILNSSNIEDFIQFLKIQKNNENNVRNRDWFDVLLTNFDNKDKYIDWFILKSFNELIAISAIQKFDDNTFRLLTRYTLINDYRRPILPNYESYYSPSVAFASYQYEYLKSKFQINKLSLIVTMESLKRRPALQRVVNKFNMYFDEKWILGSDMILTCPDAKTSKCWQNYCYLINKPSSLRKMEIESWKTIFQ